MKNKLIWMLLALLGFSAGCEDEMTAEYGCPFATYSVKGKVTDKAGAPIPGIRVSLDREYDYKYTDSDGRFAFVNHNTSFVPETLRAEDVDGPENGSYRSAEIQVTFIRNPAVLSGGWYGGDYIAADVDITMQEETPAE